MAFSDLLVRVGVEGIPAFKNAFKDAIEALETTGNRANQAGAAINKAFSNLGVADASSKVAAEAKKIEASFNLLEKSFKEGKITADDMAKATNGLAVSLTKLANTDYTASIAKLQERLSSISSTAKGFGSTLTLSLTAPILAFGGAAVKAAADMESLEIGLKAVTKETGPLSVQLERLKEVAKLPGLGFKEAVQGSINLQAAGFSANTAERALKAFGNALATVGKGRVELDGVVTALSQIASKGKISAEEINQLAERLPQIRVAIKDAFGPGFTDATAFEKAGISSEIFVEKIIAQFEKLPKAAGGFKNDLENIRDSAEQTLASFGRALLPFASSALKAIQPLIDGLQAIALEFARLPEPIQTATVGIAALLASVGPVAYAFGSLTGGLKSLVPLLSSIATAGAPAGAALGAVATSTVVLTGALIAATAAATAFAAVDAFKGASELNDAFGRLSESSDRVNKSVGQDAADSFGRWGTNAATTAAGLETLKAGFSALSGSISIITDNIGQNIWTALFPPGGLGKALSDAGAAIDSLAGRFPELEAQAKRAQQAVLDSARAQGQKAVDAYSGKNTSTSVNANIDAIFAQKAANLQELAVAEQTLKALKKMHASKEELAAATIKVTEAQRKLHPELKATGSLAGGVSNDAEKLASALSRMVKDGGANQFKALNDDLATIERGFLKQKVSLAELQAAYKTYDEKTSAVFKKQAEEFNKLVREADKAADAVSLSFAKAAEELRKDYQQKLKPVQITLSLKDQIGPALFAKVEEAQKQATALGKALQFAGVSGLSLVSQADELGVAWQTIAENVGKAYGGRLITQGQADQARLKFLEAEIRAQRELNGDVQKYQEELTELLGIVNAVQSADDAYRNSGLATLKELQVEAARAAKSYEIIATTGKDGITRILTAQTQALEAQRAMAIATGQSWDAIDDQLSRVADRLKRATDLKGVSDLQAAFRNFANDAGAVVTKSFDAAFTSLINGDFKGVGKAFSDMWKGVAASAVKDFTDPLKNALADFFGKTVRDLLKGSLSGVKEDLKDIASVIKGLFGVGSSAAGTVITNASGAASAAGSVAGGAASATGGVASAASGAGQAASSGATALVGAVAGVVSAVSGVISNFQFAGMNKSLDIIVKHTLQTANDLANLRADEWTREGHLFAKLDDLAQFTWVKLDDIVTAVRGISITGVTAGEGGALTGIEPLVSAIQSAATSIVSAIQGLNTTTATASTTTQTVVLSSVEEMTAFLAKLTQDQTVAFEALPPEIKSAINAGKIADLVNGQDQAAKDAIAGYLKITGELENVRAAINSLKTTAPPATTGTPNGANGSLDVSQIRNVITPSAGGFEISSYLGALAAFSDRMAAYWEKLFEILATGVKAVTGDASADAMKITNATEAAARDVAATVNAGTVSTDQTTAAVALTTAAVDNSASTIAQQTDVIKQAGFTLGESFLKAASATKNEGPLASFGPAAADYSTAYLNTTALPLASPSFGPSPALTGSLLPTAPALYPANSDQWKAAQMDWLRPSSTDNWKPSAEGTAQSVVTVPAPQLPILVQIDGRTVAEAVANWNEKTGYR